MRSLLPLMLAAACHLTVHAADAPPLPAVVHTQAQLNEALASGKPTPLDALTPYGKRRLLYSIAWGQRGMKSFSYTPLVRELDASQLDPILRFLDLDDYRAMLVDGMSGSPLRLPQPSAEVMWRLESLDALSREITRQRMDATSTTLGTPVLLQRYRESFALLDAAGH